MTALSYRFCADCRGAHAAYMRQRRERARDGMCIPASEIEAGDVLVDPVGHDRTNGLRPQRSAPVRSIRALAPDVIEIRCGTGLLVAHADAGVEVLR